MANLVHHFNMTLFVSPLSRNSDKLRFFVALSKFINISLDLSSNGKLWEQTELYYENISRSFSINVIVEA